MAKKETDEAIEKLKLMIEAHGVPGSDGKVTIYTILRKVSRTGMSRKISVKLATKEGDIHDLTFYAAKALDKRLYWSGGDSALKVDGCGMDMGFHLIYSLSITLYRDNPTDGGYVLNHQWL